MLCNYKLIFICCETAASQARNENHSTRLCFLCRPSCITDRNLLQGPNVGQLFRPPPFVTFDLTTLPVRAPIRLLHLSDVTPILSKRKTVQFTRCDSGTEVLAHSWLAVAPTPSVRILLMESCSASLWLWSLQNMISKTSSPPDKGICFKFSRHC